MSGPPNAYNGRNGEGEKPLSRSTVDREESTEGDDGESNEGEQESEESIWNSSTESATGWLDPPPTKREYAVRRYYGIRPGGGSVPSGETPTQQELADELGVSRTAVNRWVNEDPIPLVEDWSMRARVALFACAVTRDREALEEYIWVRRLRDRADESTDVEVESESDDPHLFDGLGEEFDPW